VVKTFSATLTARTVYTVVAIGPQEMGAWKWYR
jgi:hypothetical protein